MMKLLAFATCDCHCCAMCSFAARSTWWRSAY